MCEVRRVFHNVNTDSNAAISSSSIKKPIVKFYDQLTNGTPEIKTSKNKELKTQENEINAKENTNANKPHKSMQNDFSEPRLLTSLKIIESITNLGQENNKEKLTRHKFQPINGDRKKKASKKVNIPFDERVYKGLIELQVNDEDLGLHAHLPLKRKEFVKNKEPEPALSDFCKPKFNKEYIIKPSVPKFEINPVFITEIPSILEATKKWEPEES